MDHLLEIGILVALALPGLRVATNRAFRRVFPFDAIRIGALMLAYLMAIAVIALYLPQALQALALGGVAIGIAVLWRSRPGYGVHPGRAGAKAIPPRLPSGLPAGLPPGSLWPLPLRPWADSEFYAGQAQRYGSIFKLSQFGRPMVCVVGLDRANRLLLENDERLIAPPLPFNRFIEGGYLRYLPEEIHSQYRLAFHALFHSEVLASAEPRMRAAFGRGFDEMARVTETAGSVVVKPQVMRMMFVAWTEIFYGIDQRHTDFARLKQLFRIIDARKARWASHRHIDPALAEIEEIIERRADNFSAEDKAHPTCFLAALVRDNPSALSDRTVVGNLIYIMQITWGDLTGLLLWIFKMLSDNPAWRDRLAADGSRELAVRIALETLRLEQSESRYRRATADMELDGFRIPKGWLVRMCIRESHRDEKIFPNPLVFDPDRFVGANFTRAQYAPFGAFRLACIGEHIAKAAAALFQLELVSRFEWEVLEDGPTEMSDWVHNAPNPRLRVRLTERAGS